MIREAGYSRDEAERIVAAAYKDAAPFVAVQSFMYAGRNLRPGDRVHLVRGKYHASLVFNNMLMPIDKYERLAAKQAWQDYQNNVVEKAKQSRTSAAEELHAAQNGLDAARDRVAVATARAKEAEQALAEAITNAPPEVH